MIKLELVDNYSIPNDFSVGGWVYVLGNEFFAKDIYKIGMTTRSPEERAKELSTTGVPFDFDVIEAYYSFNPAEDEAEIHQLLSDFRINDNREFFKCDLEFIQDTFRDVGLVKKGIGIRELSMNYSFISTFKAKDYSDKIIYENLDIFGDINHVKNFLIMYAITDIRESFISKGLSIAIGNTKPRLIKNLDFDEARAQEVIDLIESKFSDKKIKNAGF